MLKRRSRTNPTSVMPPSVRQIDGQARGRRHGPHDGHATRSCAFCTISNDKRPLTNRIAVSQRQSAGQQHAADAACRRRCGARHPRRSRRAGPSRSNEPGGVQAAGLRKGAAGPAAARAGMASHPFGRHTPGDGKRRRPARRATRVSRRPHMPARRVHRHLPAPRQAGPAAIGALRADSRHVDDTGPSPTPNGRRDRSGVRSTPSVKRNPPPGRGPRRACA